MQQEQQDQIQIEERKELQDQDHPISLDDEQLYNLPQKQKVSISHQYRSVRKELEKEKPDIYTQEIQQLVQGIDKVLESHLYFWESKKDWEFNLPKTAFQGEQPPIQFFKPQAVYGTHALNRLTPEQITQIKQSGQFVVKGNTEDSSTTWRLNSWIVRGKNYRNQCICTGLGHSFHQLVQMKCRLGWRFANNYYFMQRICTPNFFDGFINIFSVASKILNLTFGVRKVQKYNKTQIIDEIIRERNQETIKQHHAQIKTSFFEYLFQNETLRKSRDGLSESQKQELDERIEGFSRLQRDFEEAANVLETKRLKELEGQGVEEEEALLQIFQEKQKLLFNLIRSKNYIQNEQVQENLIELIKATQIVKRHYYKLENDLQEYREQISKEINERNQIRHRVKLWKEDKVNEFVSIKTVELQKKYNDQIIKELKDDNLDSYLISFNRFVEFQQNEKTLYKQNYSRIQKTNTKPCRVFETFQKNFKPYRVLSEELPNGELHYFFDKGKTYKTPTSFFGWRLILQLLRYKVWTKNTFVTLINHLWNGYFGIKSLFKLRPFYGDQSINSRTGQVTGSNIIYPYLHMLIESLKGIKRTIQDFEAQPDRGIFGKGFSRIFKYLECILRFIISISLVGVGVPVLTLANIVVSFILAITSWAWIPVTLVIRWLTHLLIYDFDSANRKGWDFYPNSYQRFQSTKYFPLISAVVDLLVGTYQVGSSVASAFVLHPVLSLLSFGKSILRYLGQSISDVFMCKLTSFIGRQPEIDTFIAWKIHGAGVTRQYSYSMDIEDVKFLMRAHLEKVELNEYQCRLLTKIQEPSDIFQRLTTNLFKFYDIQQSSYRVISSSIELYSSILYHQIQKRRSKYPTMPNCNIKFTQEELQTVFFQCQNLVQSFIESRKMDWVFKSQRVESGDYKTLTEKFLVEIFSDSNILYPINELDKRIEIKTEKSGKFDQISRIIAGQTHLKTFTASIKQEFKKYKKTFLFPFIQPNEIQNNYFNKQRDYGSYYHELTPSCEAFNFNYQDYQEIVNRRQQQQQNNQN